MIMKADFGKIRQGFLFLSLSKHKVYVVVRKIEQAEHHSRHNSGDHSMKKFKGKALLPILPLWVNLWPTSWPLPLRWAIMATGTQNT